MKEPVDKLFQELRTKFEQEQAAPVGEGEQANNA